MYRGWRNLHWTWDYHQHACRRSPSHRIKRGGFEQSGMSYRKPCGTGQKRAACTDVGNGNKLGKGFCSANTKTHYRIHAPALLNFIPTVTVQQNGAAHKQQALRAYQQSWRAKVQQDQVPSSHRESVVQHKNNPPRHSNPRQPTRKVGRRPLSYQPSSSAEGLGVLVLNKARRGSINRLRNYSWKHTPMPRTGESQSQTGVMTLLTLGQQPVGWYSRWQDIVYLSITEAEYVTCWEGAKDLAWARQFLWELQLSDTNPTLWADSERAQNLSQTTKFLRRSRYIEHPYRFHYLQQQVQQWLFPIHFIRGKENPGDPLTKLLLMIAINNWKTRWIGTNGSDALR